jgi:CheY-like chemotaxis protein
LLEACVASLEGATVVAPTGRDNLKTLELVFGIMEEHHGFINVASEPGKGTDFSLYFPFYPKTAELLDEDDSMDFEVPGGDETVLILEDEEMLMELATTILTERGYNVIGASDGKEGVEIYRRKPHEIDLVISDLGLPKLTGGEALTWLKDINPEVKFILATGYINPEERAAIIENGAKEVVLKPYRPSELLKKVRRVLDS